MIGPETVARGVRLLGLSSPVVGLQLKLDKFEPLMLALSCTRPPPGQKDASGPASTVMPHWAEIFVDARKQKNESRKRNSVLIIVE